MTAIVSHMMFSDHDRHVIFWCRILLDVILPSFEHCFGRTWPYQNTVNDLLTRHPQLTQRDEPDQHNSDLYKHREVSGPQTVAFKRCIELRLANNLKLIIINIIIFYPLKVLNSFRKSRLANQWKQFQQQNIPVLQIDSWSKWSHHSDHSVGSQSSALKNCLIIPAYKCF